MATSKQLERLVALKTFEIENNWAQPQVIGAMSQIQNSGLLPPGSSASSIDLTNHTNYFRMKEDSVFAYLPYYGEQRIAGRYTNNEMGIAFEGVPEALTIGKGKKSSYLITFTINGKNKTSENYAVTLKLFSNLTSTMSINSSHRTSITYTGRVIALDSTKVSL